MRFYLGTHETSWLERADFPLFVSHRRLARRRSLPRAVVPWALDSGGFTELSMFGGWLTDPHTYAEAVARYAEEIGGLEWAAPMDWMCEPSILARTGRTVGEHQSLTVSNYLHLRSLAPELPFVPVLQGWTLADYDTHVEFYARAGVDLSRLPRVGLGSVCRRQNTSAVDLIVGLLRSYGLKLHGFGVKMQGLAEYGDRLESSDSMAWSFNARKHPSLPGCHHASCANCIRWAGRWRERVLRSLEVSQTRMAFA